MNFMNLKKKRIASIVRKESHTFDLLRKEREVQMLVNFRKRAEIFTDDKFMRN
jgi:hypothetical protein